MSAGSVSTPELIDLVDSTGSIIHHGVLRDDAEQYDGLHMQIVIAVIFNGLGQVLVHKRAVTKRVNPGDIDHVCGGIRTGEVPEDAAMREANEETGVHLKGLQVVDERVNSYGRYRYLLLGSSDEQPSRDLDPHEVEWAAYYSIEELRAKAETGEFTFVDGFFEDIEQVLA